MVYNLVYPRTTSYFHCFLVCILVPNVCQSSYAKTMVDILHNMLHIKVWHLLEGDAYWAVALILILL